MIYWKSLKYFDDLMSLDDISIFRSSIEVLAQGGLYLTRELGDHIKLRKHDEVIWVIPADFCIGVDYLYL